MTTSSEMIDKYKAAEIAVLEGQEVRFGERMLRMADLPEIRAGRAEWERRAASEAAGALGRKSFGGLGVSLANFRGD